MAPVYPTAGSKVTSMTGVSPSSSVDSSVMMPKSASRLTVESVSSIVSPSMRSWSSRWQM
uniref:Uncharacterized protein n=1 Tax=uncultured marine virus TaxID=186617 RepID=A0A0F7L3G5_9VIRU|nr:hypothetical protein [uncultured marine virus]